MRQVTRLNVQRTDDPGRFYVKTVGGAKWHTFEQRGRRSQWCVVASVEFNDAADAATPVLKLSELPQSFSRSLTTRFGSYLLVCAVCGGTGKHDESKHEFVAECERDAAESLAAESEVSR